MNSRQRMLPLLLVGLLSPVLSADGWPQFRGPNSTGVVPEGQVYPPSVWSAEQNVEWKTDIPGRGWSSPIVAGNRVFVTSVINLGEEEPPKKGLYFGGNRPEPPESVHQWVVNCLELATGKIIWSKQLHEGKPRAPIHLKNSYASETPVTDGERIYVLFGGVGIYCLDFDGKVIWKKPIEPKKTRYGWGTAASPVIHEDRVYVVNDNDEESYLIAFDKLTGKQIWKVDRDEKSNWATPYIWKTKDRTEIVVPGSGKVRSYDLEGRELWSFEGMSSITIAMPYEQNGNLIISSGYVGDKSRPLYSIRPGASGDISLSKGETANNWIAWSHPQGGPYNPSTIAYRGNIYVLLDFGFFTAYDANDGTVLYPKRRIPKGRAFTSSPWAYDGKIFCLNEDGETFVIQPGKDFKVLHTNTLAEDDMGMATPAIAGDRLLLRTGARIYCIRE